MDTKLGERDDPDELDARAAVTMAPMWPAASSSAPTQPRPAGGVVVGVDGSLGVLSAVSWAAAEAARRNVELHLVHVTVAGDEPSRRGRAWLRRALRIVVAVAPGVSVLVSTQSGAAGPALVTHTVRASLLVVGGRRPTDAGPAGDGTVAHLLVHAGCPVVVVPPRRTGAWPSTPSTRPVLAAVSESTSTHVVEHTLDLALDAARRRHVALLVVGTGNLASDRGQRRGLAQRARALGAQWLETPTDLASTLQDAGQRAQLIILGLPRDTGDTGVDAMVRDTAGTDDLVSRSPCVVMVASPVRVATTAA